MAPERFSCPCCGWPGLRARPYERWPDRFPIDALPPYQSVFGSPSHEVCLCCGFEFGETDKSGATDGESFEGWRSRWVLGGTIWFDASHEPDDWNLNRQLAAAHIDLLRPDIPRLGKMSGTGFVSSIVNECPDVGPLVDQHLEDHDGLLLHLLVADIRRFTVAAFERSELRVFNCCLKVVDRALTDGNDYLSNAIAISFIEDTDLWDPKMAGVVASWPSSMRAEAQHQRDWAEGSDR